MKLRQLALGLLLLASCGLAAAGESGHISVALQDAEAPVSRYAAAGKPLILWLPSEYGVLAAEHIAARHLAEKGLETWLPDLYGARFLPVVPSSAESMTADDVYRIIRAAAQQQPRRQIWLLTSGRGAKYALEGAALWSKKEGRKRPLAGAVLLLPNLYVKQPDPGEDPHYLPIVSQTRLNIALLQGELSPWYWTMDSLHAALAGQGSQVRTQTFPGIRDRFYFREGATPAERALGERLPEIVANAIHADHRSQK